MVGLECLERALERLRHRRHLGLLLRREIVEVLVERLARLDLLLDAIEPGMSMAALARLGIRRPGPADDIPPAWPSGSGCRWGCGSLPNGCARVGEV